MKRKMLKALSASLIILSEVILCFVIFYLVDYVWNGSFVDWFDANYMITTEDVFLPDVEKTFVIHRPDWEKVKLLLLLVLIGCAVAGTVIVFGVAFLYGKIEKRKTVADISQLLHTHIVGGESNETFAQEYPEISAQIAEIKSAMLRNTQALQNEATRKNDLVAYLAHDLRTPLTSIIGYLNLLEEAPDMPPEQKAKYTHIALEKAYRLENLVNEFFEIARYNLQQIDIKKESIDLYYMLVQVTDELYPLLSARGNTAVLRACEDLTVDGDPDKLARVFNNILKNAAAYSSSNSEIIISAERENNQVIIHFQNQGPTIPADRLSLIFEKFYRLDESRSSETGGAGLGLAIAKEIVEAHGGSITAQSEDGVTTFTVKLPALNQ